MGGELCRAALMHGREELAYTLLRDLHEVMQRDHGALFTWYHQNGSAAINAPHNQTNYDPWGLSPWAAAIIEELAVRLNLDEGGELVENLTRLYEWWGREVVEAGSLLDRSRLDRVSRQMGDLRQTWEQAHQKRAGNPGTAGFQAGTLVG